MSITVTHGRYTQGAPDWTGRQGLRFGGQLASYRLACHGMNISNIQFSASPIAGSRKFRTKTNTCEKSQVLFSCLFGFCIGVVSVRGIVAKGLRMRKPNSLPLSQSDPVAFSAADVCAIHRSASRGHDNDGLDALFGFFASP